MASGTLVLALTLFGGTYIAGPQTGSGLLWMHAWQLREAYEAQLVQELRTYDPELFVAWAPIPEITKPLYRVANAYPCLFPFVFHADEGMLYRIHAPRAVWEMSYGTHGGRPAPFHLFKQFRQLGILHVHMMGEPLERHHLDQIATVSSLEGLHLIGGELPEDTPAHLTDLRGLGTLVLDAMPRATGDNLAPLLKMPHLRDLHIYDTRIDDSAVDVLIRMQGLEYLSLRWSEISPAALARLKRGLPNAFVAAD